MENLRMEEVGNKLFRVFSGDNTYLADVDGNCTCPGRFYNDGLCSHVKAVKRYVVRQFLKPKREVCANCREEVND